jgi:hypothetical protein
MTKLQRVDFPEVEFQVCIRRMKFDTSVKRCEKLKGNWEIPDLETLSAYRPQLKNLGLTDGVWSSDEFSTNSVWIVDMNSGLRFLSGKNVPKKAIFIKRFEKLDEARRG